MLHLNRKKISIFISLSSLLLSIVFFITVVENYDKLILRTVYNDYNYYWLKIISIIAIIISIISFVLNDEIKINILFIFFGIFIAFFIFEMVLNILFQARIKNINTANPFVQMPLEKTLTRDEFYQKLINNNKKPTFDTPAITLVFKDDNKSLFSLGGISNRYTIHCNENGYWSTYNSDRYGFNNPDSEWDKKSIDFLLIGDSLVHGSCVDPEYNIAGVIRKISNGNSVLNLANRGAGALIEYAFLREYLKYIQPKRVIWFFSESNDKNDLLKEVKNKYLLNYLENEKFSQNLAVSQQKIDKRLLEIQEKIKIQRQISSQTKNKSNFSIIMKASYKFLRLRILFGNTLSEILPNENFKKILNLSKNLVEHSGAKFYFVYHPDSIKYFDQSNNKIFANYRKIHDSNDIITLVKNLNIPVIDLHEKVYKNHPDVKSIYPPAMHPNEHGYKIIAETVFKEISKLETKNN